MVSRSNPLPSVALGALLLLTALLARAAAPAPLPVPTLEAGAASTSASLDVEAVLQAQQQVHVSAQAAGRVLALAVKAGDRVKAGQLLARIDDRELQAGVAGGDAGVAQARAALLQAEQSAQRARELRVQGFISSAALDSANAQLQAAQAGLNLAQAGRSQAALARGHATLTAPFDGVVLATMVEAGDLATPGRPLLTLYAPGRLRAVVQLPASRAALARAATAVDITLPGGQRVQPVQRTELPVTDAVSQTIEWRLDLSPAAAAKLSPGQPVQVRFSGAAAASAAPAGLSIPASAVLVRGELTAVYAAQDGRFVLKAVRLGVREGDRVPVLAGLRAGERIAADPVRAGLTGATPQQR